MPPILPPFQTDPFNNSKNADNLLLTTVTTNKMFSNYSSLQAIGDDEEDWIPPSPPPYDVAEKLLEANQRLDSDPFSNVHVPEKLRWRPESRLVEVKWIHSISCSGESEGEDEEDQDTVSYLNQDLGLTYQEVVIVEDLATMKLAQAELHSISANKMEDSESSEDNSSVSLVSLRPSYGPKEDVLPENGQYNAKVSVCHVPNLMDHDVDNDHDNMTRGNSNNNNTNTSSRNKSDLSSSSGSSSRNDYNKSVAVTCQDSLNSPESNKVAATATSIMPTRPTSNLPRNSKQPKIKSKRPKPSSSLVAQNRSNSVEMISICEVNNNSSKSPNSNCSKSSANSKSKQQCSTKTGRRMSNSTSLPNLVDNSSSRSSSSSPAPLFLSHNINNEKKVNNFVSRSSTLSAPPMLQRKTSRNSLSSNSSISSHSTTTEDSDSSRSKQLQKQAADHAFLTWKQRKKEEKRLKERRAYLQMQLRRQL